MKILLLSLFLTHFMIGSTSRAATLSISPKEIPNLVLKQGLDTQAEILKQQQNRINLAEIRKNYDFQLTADVGNQYSKFEGLSRNSPLNDQTTTANIKLAKPFYTGTTLALEYNKASDRPELVPGSLSIGNYEQNIFGLSLEQNLWRNFFGVAARADLRSVEAGLKASKISEISNLQDVVLTAIRAYWSAYVAQETFQEAVRSRDRYQKVVSSVKKKTGYGYTNPGDSAQAQAELESREQIVKTASISYLASVDALVTLLNLPPQSEIKFVVPEKVNPPPEKPADVNIETLRPVQASLLKLEAATESLKSAQSNSYPDLSLVGRYSAQGLDPSSSESYSEMTSGTRPRYYVGLKLQYNFGSGYQKENEINKRINQQLASLDLQKQRLLLADQKNNLLRQLQAFYSIVQSTQVQKTFREKASLELSRSYNQGRTDIAILIDSLNKYFDAEVRMTRAIGDYQTALSEWQAFQDQLVVETSP
jgi:outer membrane protein TolC